MTKQEIANLKVDDKIKKNNLTLTIKEIKHSHIIGKLFILKEWDNVLLEDELKKFNRITKKTPYTFKTFPENALYVRKIGENWFGNIIFRGTENLLVVVGYENTEEKILKKEEVYFEDTNFYEIGCQIIKDGKIEIEWLPFYQEI